VCGDSIRCTLGVIEPVRRRRYRTPPNFVCNSRVEPKLTDSFPNFAFGYPNALASLSAQQTSYLFNIILDPISHGVQRPFALMRITLLPCAGNILCSFDRLQGIFPITAANRSNDFTIGRVLDIDPTVDTSLSSSY